MPSSANKALTLEDRKIIQRGIENESTKAAIARTVGKDKSTIGKEIRLHRYAASRCTLSLECAFYKKCKFGRYCRPDCPEFVQFTCSRRDRSPGACNGCSDYSHCRFTKYRYDAERAESEYRHTLVDCRTGVNLTSSEAKEIGSIVKKALSLGHSPYQIIQDNPDIGICEKTLYNYIDQKVFSVVGIQNICLRRKCSRKPPKRLASNYKKRKDNSYLLGRTYQDYLSYIENAPATSVVEMDTVYNDVTNGPFIQTFKLMKYDLMIAVYHESKTARDMVLGLDLLEQALGSGIFRQVFEVTLTDRGAEFSDASGFEHSNDGSLRTHVFYCDPMRSGQKGSLEVHHEQLRYILPKQTDLRSLGLTDQFALNFAISNIASSSQPYLSGKSAIEYVRFMYPELWEKLEKFGIHEIPRDCIDLTDRCLRKYNR